jgi:hypothetical protein
MVDLVWITNFSIKHKIKSRELKRQTTFYLNNWLESCANGKRSSQRTKDHRGEQKATFLATDISAQK